MKMSIKRLALLAGAILVLALLVAVMAGYFNDRIEPGLHASKAVDTSSAVEVVRLTRASTEPVPGSVEAREATNIASRLLARITAIDVRAGDYVEAGQLLLTLESTDLRARVAQSKEQLRAIDARLTEARQSLARARELHDKALIAAADFDAAQANASSLEADLANARRVLEEAETTLGYAEIRSPIAGRVVDRLAEPGDTVSPGTTLLSLYNPFSLWVEAWVRERLALSLQQGQALEVEIPALSKVYTARVEEIVPAADPGSRSFLVKAVVPSAEGLLPGMYARLLVPTGERARLAIPLDRVARVGQLDVVWVAAPNQIVRRFVSLGQPLDSDLVEVVAGLEEGDKVLPVP